jgi:hypothetical protein
MANVATINTSQAELDTEMAAEPSAEHRKYATHKNKNAPEDWGIPFKKKK